MNIFEKNLSVWWVLSDEGAVRRVLSDECELVSV